MRPMVPLSIDTDPWRALLSRSDIRMHDGILHVVDDTSTPSIAERDDLLTAASAIEAAGVRVLLVRDANRRPKLVVDTADAEAALTALRDPELGPIYLKARGEDPVPAHSVHPSAGSVQAYAVFRPRTSTEGSYRYGASLAPRLELWRFGEKTIEAPRPSALTRRRFAAADLDLVEIERYGRRWMTVSGMFDPHPNEFTAVLLREKIAISMDGKGCWRDNVFVECLWRPVKYEEVYLNAYTSVPEARAGIGGYIGSYNAVRPHSALGGRTPNQIYFDQPLLTAA